MALPIVQIMIGITVGVLGFLLLRPRRIQAAPVHCHVSEDDPSERRRFYTKPGETCVICLEEMKQPNMHYLPCRHAMHLDCYKECEKKKNNSCPLCRKSFN